MRYRRPERRCPERLQRNTGYRLKLAVILPFLTVLLAMQTGQAEPPQEEVVDGHGTHLNAVRRGFTRALGEVGKTITGGQDRRQIIGWKTVRVPSRPLKDCLGPNKELNKEVLRCRNGYTKRVPIYDR